MADKPKRKVIWACTRCGSGALCTATPLTGKVPIVCPCGPFYEPSFEPVATDFIPDKQYDPYIDDIKPVAEDSFTDVIRCIEACRSDILAELDTYTSKDTLPTANLMHIFARLTTLEEKLLPGRRTT